MINAFAGWLIQNWNMIIDVFMWALTILLAVVLAAKIYKIAKLEFEVMDLIGLIASGLWLMTILFFGFDHVRTYLQSFL